MSRSLFESVSFEAPHASVDAGMEVRLAAALESALPEQESRRAFELAETVADILRGEAAVVRMRPGSTASEIASGRLLLEQLVRLSADLPASRQEAAVRNLANVILPDELGPARASFAIDNLRFRDRVVADVPMLTGLQVGEQAGHTSKNPYATAARWKRDGAIFSVSHRGIEYFPAFQFRDGRPHPTIKTVLAALPSHLSAWQRAAWFISTNGWLDGAAPYTCLDEAERVSGAARRDVEDVIG